MRSTLTVLVMTTLAAFSGISCQSGAPTVPAADVPAVKTVDVQTEYERSLAAWREERRWATFFWALVVANKDPHKLHADALPTAAAIKLLDDVIDLESETMGVEVLLLDAERSRSLEDIGHKESVIKQWQATGAKIRSKRVDIMTRIMQDVWKSEYTDRTVRRDQTFVETAAGVRMQQPQP
jgi:hypothetical protein